MSVVLQNRDEFNAVLENYQASDEVREILSHISLGIFLGLSASGRNTIINELLKTKRYHFIVSDTTRPPKNRDGVMEQDGINYHFRREGDMLEELKQGTFLEAEVIHNQQVSGISIRELRRAADSGKIPLNEVDIAGTQNIRTLKPDTTFIFVLPPSYEVWMERLTNREIISDDELENRKATAIRVLDQAFQYDDWQFIVNDDLSQATQAVDEIMNGTRDSSMNEDARRAASDIRAQLEN